MSRHVANDGLPKWWNDCNHAWILDFNIGIDTLFARAAKILNLPRLKESLSFLHPLLLQLKIHLHVAVLQVKALCKYGAARLHPSSNREG